MKKKHISTTPTIYRFLNEEHEQLESKQAHAASAEPSLAMVLMP
jgi:hypothetical protein